MNWAAPTTPVLKSDGQSIRIFKVIVNQASKLNKYPIPKVEESSWEESCSQNWIIMSQAYQQVLLDKVCCDQYSLWIISVLQVAIRYCISPWYFPAGDGEPPSGNHRGGGISG